MSPSITAATSDSTLVLRAQDGDVPAFEALVDRHQAGLFRVAYLMLGDRQDSEDVVQEAFLLAWRRLHLLREPAAFRSWLNRICTQRAMDAVRRQARRATDAVDLTEDTASATPGHTVGGGTAPPDPSDAVQVKEQLSSLAEVLSGLDADLRACWVLREIDGLSYAQIAEVLRITEPTVRGRLSRARRHIIERMKEWR